MTTRRTGHEGLHARVVQDKRDAEKLRQVASEIREARLSGDLRSRVAELLELPTTQARRAR